MTNHTIKHSYTHAFAKDDSDVVLALELQKKLNDIKNRLIQKVRTSPEYKHARSLHSGVAHDPEFSANFAAATVAFTWNAERPSFPPSVSPREYLDPKTLNQLLNGPLLTNAQKRTLLRNTFPKTFQGVLSDGKAPDQPETEEGPTT